MRTLLAVLVSLALAVVPAAAQHGVIPESSKLGSTSETIVYLVPTAETDEAKLVRMWAEMKNPSAPQPEQKLCWHHYHTPHEITCQE